MRYELTKDLETGNAVIDKEHRELIQAVNSLMDACSSGRGRAAMDPAVKFLLNYVDQHFAHEEQLMQTSRYPGLTAHKAFHMSYKVELKKLVSLIPAAGPGVGDLAKLNSHIGVLVNHIKTDDKKLGTFLSQR